MWDYSNAWLRKIPLEELEYPIERYSDLVAVARDKDAVQDVCWRPPDHYAFTGFAQKRESFQKALRAPSTR